VLESKRMQLEEYERSEAEARRLDQVLDKALNRVKPIDSDGEVDSPPGEGSGLPQQSQSTPDLSAPSMATSRSMTKSSSGSLGFLGALTHTVQSLVDTDPEASRRNSIGKTRELIAHVSHVGDP
jgi:hypothetical protein